MPKIVISPFAMGRHFVEGKPYSMVGIGEEFFLARVQRMFAEAKPSYREGVVLVPIDADGIYSPVVKVTDENKHLLRTVFEARQAGEAPGKKTVIDCAKSQAVAVDVVLYRKDVLAETNDVSDESADWEVISVNARIQKEPEPMNPMALARNLMGLAGGSKAEFTPENCKTLAEGIVYWSDKAMATL